MKKVLIVMPLLSLLSIILIQGSFADIQKYYKYIDKNGTECYADNLQSIPEEYKKKAVIISVQFKKDESRQSEVQSENGVPSSATENKKETAKIIDKEKVKEAIEGFVRSSLFKFIAVIIGFLLVFIIVGKVSSSLGHRGIGTLLRIALALLVLLYVFNSYLEEIVGAFTMLKEEVMGVKKQAEERNEKADKTMNELFNAPQK